jgi:pimeloyl-ACP methyl ester carboxylesterase
MSTERDELVLFVHSTGTGPYLFSGVSSEAIGGRKPLLPSNLGYAPEPLIERGRVLGAVDDAEHVLRAIPEGDVPIHVVAHSYGGLVALHAVPQLASRLASVFFYEPVVFGSLAVATETEANPEAILQAKTFLGHPWFLTDPEKGGTDEWLELFIDYWNRPGSWSKMPPPLRELTLSLGWKMFQEVRACFLEQVPIGAWNLPVPTTIAYGDRTTVASRAMSQTFARNRPNVTLVEVAGVGHMAPLTHADKVHAEIARHFVRFDNGRAT